MTAPALPLAGPSSVRLLSRHEAALRATYADRGTGLPIRLLGKEAVLVRRHGPLASFHFLGSMGPAPALYAVAEAREIPALDVSADLARLASRTAGAARDCLLRGSLHAVRAEDQDLRDVLLADAVRMDDVSEAFSSLAATAEIGEVL